MTGAGERTLRPSPDAFDPADLDAATRAAYRATWDRCFGPLVPDEEIRTQALEVEPWFPAPSKPTPRGLWDGLLHRLSGSKGEDEERARRKVGHADAVWGLWAGFFSADEHEPAAVRDLEAAAFHALNLDGIDVPFWGEVLAAAAADALSPPGRGPARPVPDGSPRPRMSEPPASSSLPRCGPALPASALLKLVFVPPGYHERHIEQLMVGVPWPSVLADPSDRDRCLTRLRHAAPALTGVVAGSLYSKLLFAVIEEAPTEKMSAVAHAWLEVVVMNETRFRSADNGKGQWVDALTASDVVHRDRPLRPPFACVDLLHLALWANWNDPSFEDAVRAARELGGDAWACAAAGAIAVARRGRASIPAAALARIPSALPVGTMAERHASLLASG